MPRIEQDASNARGKLRQQRMAEDDVELVFLRAINTLVFHPASVFPMDLFLSHDDNYELIQYIFVFHPQSMFCLVR